MKGDRVRDLINDVFQNKEFPFHFEGHGGCRFRAVIKKDHCASVWGRDCMQTRTESERPQEFAAVLPVTLLERVC
jgi:hypothetical protein